MAEVKQVKETEVIKFTEEEIEKIGKFRQEFSEVTARLGEVEIELTLIETQKTNIENFKAQLKQKYLEMRESEIKLAGELKEKYGEGEFDINTGVFTPNV
jgi:predicted nuclease with TOPRIM domain